MNTYTHLSCLKYNYFYPSESQLRIIIWAVCCTVCVCMPVCCTVARKVLKRNEILINEVPIDSSNTPHDVIRRSRPNNT